VLDDEAPSLRLCAWLVVQGRQCSIRLFYIVIRHEHKSAVRVLFRNSHNSRSVLPKKLRHCLLINADAWSAVSYKQVTCRLPAFWLPEHCCKRQQSTTSFEVELAIRSSRCFACFDRKYDSQILAHDAVVSLNRSGDSSVGPTSHLTFAFVYGSAQTPLRPRTDQQYTC